VSSKIDYLNQEDKAEARIRKTSMLVKSFALNVGLASSLYIATTRYS